MDDPYAYDDDLLNPGPRSRSHSRHRSVSRRRSFSHAGGGGIPFGYSPSSMSAVPQTAFPGHAGSYTGSYAGSQGGVPMPIPIHGSSYGGMGSSSAYGPSMPPMGVSPSQYSAPMMGVASSYHGSAVGATPMGYSRSRSSSMSYPQQYPQYPQQYGQQPYMGTAMSAGSMGMPVGVPASQTIVIHKGKKHKHRSRRSRSSDGEYDGHHSSRY